MHTFDIVHASQVIGIVIRSGRGIAASQAFAGPAASVVVVLVGESPEPVLNP
jgi:hypothetical protein